MQSFPRRFAKKILAILAPVVVLALWAPAARAQASNEVGVFPLNQTVEGFMPFTQQYQLIIQSPLLYPSGVTSHVALNATATAYPIGDQATAETYIQFIDPATNQAITEVTFTGPNQLKSVYVRVDLPLLGLPGAATTGSFFYQIDTSGWPALVGGAALLNHTSYINAIAKIDPSSDPARLPPLVTISTPNEGQVFAPTSLPTTVDFSFVATARPNFGIISVDASINGPGFNSGMGITPLTLVSNSDSTNVTASAQITITQPGAYTVRANAHNSVGDATDSNSFVVNFLAPPPVAVINSPANGSTYTIRAGGSGISIPIGFTATSSLGGIQSLNVMIDGAPAQYTASSLGALVVTGSSTYSYFAGGTHTLTVNATDPNGTSQTVSSTFTINFVGPTPAIAINLTNGTAYTIPPGATSINIPFTLLSSSTNDFTVDTVTATWSGGSAPALSHTPGLGSVSPVTSSGTLLNVGPGTYTINAKTTSAGYAATASATFTVAAPLPLPTVAITAPTLLNYTVSPGSPALSIPLAFVGTSNALGGVITNLTATLDGAPLTVSGLLGLKVATGTATLNIPATDGSHVVVVTATDFVGTATANQTLTVAVTSTKNVSGIAFFDVDFDGTLDAGEFGLAGVTVKLLNSANAVVATGTTNASGAYFFTGIAPGAYTVAATTPAGMKATTASPQAITISTTNVTVPAFGFGLDFKALQGMSACGFTIGYWKNNLDKAISGKTAGIQVPAASLATYTNQIGNFALAPFDLITMKQASATMGSTSSAPKDLLAKQLLASEYNYQNGAYLNGNQNLTFLFVWWGEYVLKNSSSYSGTYLIWVKDWFDAYNNSHCGLVAGPSAIGSTSIAANFNGTSIAAGNYIWFNAIVTVTGRSNTVATSVYFDASTIQFTANGTPVSLYVSPTVVTFDPAATTASTVYDSVGDKWQTTVPASYTGNVVAATLGYKTPVALAGGINNVTWSGSFTSATANLTAQWKWAAAVYTQFTDNRSLIGVKPTDSNTANPYLNSDHAGTPEAYKSYVTGGAMGGGGSNWTGSYSGTASTAVGPR